MLHITNYIYANYDCFVKHQFNTQSTHHLNCCFSVQLRLNLIFQIFFTLFFNIFSVNFVLKSFSLKNQ